MLNNTLSKLKPGQSALIRSIYAEKAFHQRLIALGFRIGKRVELIRRAGFSGPVHLRIGTTDVIMRRAEAQSIEVSDIITK
jgi:ferrous iron transport protein A